MICGWRGVLDARIMGMIIYEPKRVDREAFVMFWSQRYQYTQEHLYDNNIGFPPTIERILALFIWKNGTPLSALKQQSVRQNFVQRIDELKSIPLEENASDFLERFSAGGAIWRIFWLHCWQPNKFPIYDQHVHRAMTFIKTGKLEEIPVYDPRKIDSYIKRYMPFYSEFRGIDHREVDRALWSFGKFLNESNFPVC